MAEIHIEHGDHDGTQFTTVRPEGDIDAYSVGQFREALGEIADVPRLLIDLGGVPFMDSAGLGALIGGIRKARDNESTVVVSCERPALIRLLHTTGFDRIVPVAESYDEAVNALFEGDS